ncbi:UrcA family protein [Sphingomonas alba]|uniref:UrcA family protein n=1 Tax=Sphingomonas alba TaxID=2908208 RepID=A0ABT0RNB8_9SPHN|nr:UrcA family protein [Sphingomonas alba]MCL6684141.1 UrcA family protein [Sphingomonas alba]
MSRYFCLNTLAAVLIGAATASSATAEDITVNGPGERIVARTNIGAEVVEYTTSVVINVRDLDLVSPAGWNALEERLTFASRDACDVLKQRIPIELLTESSGCERTAYRAAIARARELTKAASN